MENLDEGIDIVRYRQGDLSRQSEALTTLLAHPHSPRVAGCLLGVLHPASPPELRLRVLESLPDWCLPSEALLEKLLFFDQQLGQLWDRLGPWLEGSFGEDITAVLRGPRQVEPAVALRLARQAEDGPLNGLGAVMAVARWMALNPPPAELVLALAELVQKAPPHLLPRLVACLERWLETHDSPDPEVETVFLALLPVTGGSGLAKWIARWADQDRSPPAVRQALLGTLRAGKHCAWSPMLAFVAAQPDDLEARQVLLDYAHTQGTRTTRITLDSLLDRTGQAEWAREALWALYRETQDFETGQRLGVFRELEDRIERLGDGDPEVHLAALAELMDQDPRALPGHYPDTIRRHLEAIDDPRALVLMAQLLPEDEVSFEYGYALESLGKAADRIGARACQTALGLLDQEATRLTGLRLFQASANCLGLSHELVEQRLAAFLQDRELSCRKACAGALGKSACPSAVPALLEALADVDLCGSAAQALGNLRDPRAVSPLLDVLLDASGEVCWGAAYALKALVGEQGCLDLMSQARGTRLRGLTRAWRGCPSALLPTLEARLAEDPADEADVDELLRSLTARPYEGLQADLERLLEATGSAPLSRALQRLARHGPQPPGQVVQVLEQHGFRVELDRSNQVLGLSVLPAHQTALHPTLGPLLRAGRMVPAAALGLKAKQFDDGLLAAVESARAPDVRRLLERWLAGLGGSKSPILEAGLAAAKGVVPDQEGADTLPLGFYTWSEELRAIYRRDRLLSRPLEPGQCALLRQALQRAEAVEAYTDLIALNSGLHNPPARPPLWPPGAGEACILPGATSPESKLAEKRVRGDLMDALVAAIRGRDLNLEPTPSSGWYDHQLYALETLVCPDEALEAPRLSLDAQYRQALEKLFRLLAGLTRESHIKALDLGDTGGPGDGVVLRPALEVEPLATYYLRRADSYRFVSHLLQRHLGGELARLRRLTRQGPVDLPLDEELFQLEELFRGCAAVAAANIGLRLEEPPGDSTLATARAWLARASDDPDVLHDARMLVPLSYDRQTRIYRVQVFLGWTSVPLQLDFHRPPEVRVFDDAGRPVTGMVSFDPDGESLPLPITAEVEVRQLLDREVFVELCEQHSEPSAVLAALTSDV